MAPRSNFEIQIDGGVLVSSFSIDSSVLHATVNSDRLVTSWRRPSSTINMQGLTAPSTKEALTMIEALSSVDPLSPSEFPLLSLLFGRGPLRSTDQGYLARLSSCRAMKERVLVIYLQRMTFLRRITDVLTLSRAYYREG